MKTESVLTDEHIFALAAETDIASIDPKVDVLMFSRDEMLQAGRAIEKAVLQSPEIQALKAVSNEYNELIRHMDAGGDFFEFQSGRAAMEKQP